MRKRAQRNIPHVQLTLALLMTLMASLVLAGCGGGGGGGTPTPPNPTTPTSSATLATVTGIVTDTTAAATPVAGATVSLVGTSLTTKTGTDGKFVFYNAPVGTVRIAVLTPNPAVYYGDVEYQGKEYNSQMCPITITTIASGRNGTVSPLPASLQLFPNSAAGGPPAPPLTSIDANGCPK